MYDNSYNQLGLDNLIESDLTSYEYFKALPQDIQKRVRMKDFSSFDEMCSYVSKLRQMRSK
ncbi:MAG: hypothetical protein IJP17_08195 [Clostridia bacterium]|nr:hypothetical protein [Clostridia bacterium]